MAETLPESREHLGFKAGFVVVSHPLILFDSIWDFLVLDHVDRGPLEESANLKREKNNYIYMSM